MILVFFHISFKNQRKVTMFHPSFMKWKHTKFIENKWILDAFLVAMLTRSLQSLVYGEFLSHVSSSTHKWVVIKTGYQTNSLSSPFPPPQCSSLTTILVVRFTSSQLNFFSLVSLIFFIWHLLQDYGTYSWGTYSWGIAYWRGMLWIGYALHISSIFILSICLISSLHTYKDLG